EYNRVTIGDCASHLAGTYRAAATGIAIFDDDPLPERRAYLVGHGARHNVIGPTRRQRNDKDDWPRRIVIGRACDADGEQDRCPCCNRASQSEPALLHSFSLLGGYRRPIVPKHTPSLSATSLCCHRWCNDKPGRASPRTRLGTGLSAGLES